MMKKPKYLPAGSDTTGKSSKMLSDNLRTTGNYRDEWERIFKDAPKRKGSTI